MAIKLPLYITVKRIIKVSLKYKQLNIPKFNITTDGNLIIYTRNNSNSNNNLHNIFSMETLVTYQEQRIKAMEDHIQMLEDECNALYSQINDCEGQC